MATIDRYAFTDVGADVPADEHFQITPHDTNDLPALPRCIKVGAGGDMVIESETGVQISYAVQSGEIFPFRAAKVLATGTTATNLVGWY